MLTEPSKGQVALGLGGQSRFRLGSPCGKHHVASEVVTMPPAFAVEQVQTSADQGEIRIRGSLRFAEAAPLWTELRRLETRASRGQTLNFEMSAVQRIDGGAMALLACVRGELQRRGVKVRVRGGRRARAADHPSLRRRPRGGAAQTSPAAEHSRSAGPRHYLHPARGAARARLLRADGGLGRRGLALAPLGQLARAAGDDGALGRRRGADHHLDQLPGRPGDGVPGGGAAQTVWRQHPGRRSDRHRHLPRTRALDEIVICGRSGAAFAAELGFMQVNEEIDALRTMGFGPMRYLVLPRALALIIVVPLLALLADMAGVLGGLVVGVTNLDLTVRGYLSQTARVVSLWDISSGIIKSVVFAFAVALIACQQGLATSGGAEGVGRRTTSTVVITMFTLILLDAVMTVFFRMAGL